MLTASFGKPLKRLINLKLFQFSTGLIPLRIENKTKVVTVNGFYFGGQLE